MPNTALRADLQWRELDTLTLPPAVRDWLSDPGSLTARLRRHGRFQVRPGASRVGLPEPAERRLLGHSGRRWALIREVILLLDGEPAVEARSVLPLTTLNQANRGLGHMGSRSLGSELYRRPAAERDQVWARLGTTPHGRGPCWGRQSRFLKRGRPLLVAEYFLPGVWQRLGETVDRI
ncbi:chorismate--pyruvate lyase family protein [Alloalcanivorax mobilis]|uniref:chorismate--pyruvate lyase family protein n=1 Tax=Alloalcanivorax mobilis TaxID=2019569 RepID=UPI000C773011|nr:chorismate lyase [Alloalcanivorax mobilis]